MTKSDVLHDVKEVFGFVPGFIDEAPEQEVVPMWGLFKDLVLTDTTIPRKYKTLIEIGVGAALHDRYRLHLSTEMAKSQGISPEEIREAVTVADSTVFGSTWLNGYQIDLETFKSEFRRIADKAKDMKGVPPSGDLNTRGDIERDIESIMGFVPQFLRELPDVGLKHFWKVLRGVYLEQTLIPNKYKELIGLSVASVIGCRYCIFFHTESAKLYGAMEGEIKEAVLLASRVRNWGTMMYGTQYDLENLKKESRKIVEGIKKRVPAGVR